MLAHEGHFLFASAGFSVDVAGCSTLDSSGFKFVVCIGFDRFTFLPIYPTFEVKMRQLPAVDFLSLVR